MGSQQLCLRWNHHHANLLGGFERLLSLEKFVDVTLACEGASLKAHKVVLSACSSFFEELFLENPCKHPIVILKDIRYADLTAIVEFMYRGEVSIPQEQLSSLLTTSSTLRIKGLAEVAGGDNHVASQGFEDDAASAPPSPRRKRARPKRHSSAESNAVTSDSDDDSSLPVLCTRSQPNEQIAVESPPNRRMTALPPTSSTAISVAGSSKNGNDATAVTSIMATDVDNQAGYVLQPAVLMEQTSDNLPAFPGFTLSASCITTSAAVSESQSLSQLVPGLAGLVTQVPASTHGKPTQTNVNPVSSTLLLSRYRPNPAEAARPLKASGDNFVSTVTVPIAVVSSPCHKEEQECLTSHGMQESVGSSQQACLTGQGRYITLGDANTGPPSNAKGTCCGHTTDVMKLEQQNATMRCKLGNGETRKGTQESVGNGQQACLKRQGHHITPAVANTGPPSNDKGACCSHTTNVIELEQQNTPMRCRLGNAQGRNKSVMMAKWLKPTASNKDPSIPTVDTQSMKVNIGSGVLVDRSTLQRLHGACNNNPSRFARSLVRTLFTVDEMRGRSLFGKKSNAHKDALAKQALDPVRVDAILGYTCSKYLTNTSCLKHSISTMLNREIK